MIMNRCDEWQQVAVEAWKTQMSIVALSYNNVPVQSNKYQIN